MSAHTETLLGHQTMAVLRHHLQELLADEVVDALLDKVAGDLDAAGNTAVSTELLARLRDQHRLYQSALTQLGHAIELALAEEQADG